MIHRNSSTTVTVLLGAVNAETEGLQRSMAVEQATTGPGCRLLEGTLGGKDIVLARTGPGMRRAEEIGRFILANYRADAVVSFGLGGALVEDLRAGDLVVCCRCYSESSTGAGLFRDADPELLCLATQVESWDRTGIRFGRGISLDRLVTDPEEKRAMGNRFGVQVVDMESYWVAGVASERRVPFLAVRAVSDTLSQRLPPFDRFLNPQGGWLGRRAALHFLSHPRDAMSLPWVFANSKRAVRNLTLFLGRLVSAMHTGAARTT